MDFVCSLACLRRFSLGFMFDFRVDFCYVVFALDFA